MASLPISLPNGIIAIYGMGTAVSTTGIELTGQNNPLRFGSVYQIYDGGAVFIYGGDNVMFSETDVMGRVVYSGIPYTLIPARLVTKENILL